MKKVLYFALILIIIILLISLNRCNQYTPSEVVSSLPGYLDRDMYTEGGCNDFTDYGKYYYESIIEEDLIYNPYYQKADADDVEKLLSYLEHYEQVIISGYDFDKSIINEGDYFCIITKEGERINDTTDHVYGKFDHYSIYFIDLETEMLYYFNHDT